MDCYVATTSARPGDRINVHASTSQGQCDIEITRLGLSRGPLVQMRDVAVGDFAVPEGADQNGCNWPIAAEILIPETAKTGYHEVKCTDPTGASSVSFLCIRSDSQAQKAKFLLVLATNTYVAYNYWGGANSYADVTRLMRGEIDTQTARDAAIGRLSTQRPFPKLLINAPHDAPRLLNRNPRGFKEPGIPGDMDWLMQHRPTAYDGSAGFTNKWEHAFVRWCEQNGFELDYACDHDFETDAALLDGYNCVLFVGHSEYWSLAAREQLDRYVDAGGNLAIFSGNTSYWKVRWEDQGKNMVAHKWNGAANDPLWPAMESTHLWSHPIFAKPEAQLTGLSFLYGGYHRLAMCVARGSAGYTIYDPQHWALVGSDLFYGDVLGADVALISYENDGCPIGFGEDGLPLPQNGLGIPQDMHIIGIAPATLFEDVNSPFAGLIPCEDPATLAEIAYPDLDPAAAAKRLLRGHAVMASFKRGAGEIFNGGTTEWAHALAAGNKSVEIITKNVLNRFGG